MNNAAVVERRRTRRVLGSRPALARRACELVLALLMGATSSAFGQTAIAAESPPPAKSDVLTRSQLTGDWGGARSLLADKGVTVDVRHTSTYQGLVSGTGDGNHEYGGKFDVFVNFDSAKMGLWDGGGFRSHLEYSHGPAPANLGGAIFAVNTALYWPVDTPDKWVATSLYLTQAVGDRTSIAVGKFNPVDLLAGDPFFGGWGIDRFMNIVFAAPPSGLVPVVFMGAIANVKSEPVSWTVMVFDPKDRTNDYFPGDLFSDGVNVSVTGSHATTLAGRKTSYAVTANYSSAPGIDFSSLPQGMHTTTKKGSYNVAFQFSHTLQEQGNANWGLYLKAAVADGNPNYVQSSIIAGIGGRALFFGRPQDSFGVGAFKYNLSDVLQSSLAPFVTFRDEAGLEIFYTYTVTPWLAVGADIQYIKPATGGNGNALVSALRAQIRF